MTKNTKYGKSATMLIIRIIAAWLVLVAGGALSFGWSFGETLKVTGMIIPIPMLAFALAILIQYLPNVLLMFYPEAQKPVEKLAIIGGVIFFNGINFATNAIAFTRWFDAPANVLNRQQLGYDNAAGVIYTIAMIIILGLTYYEEIGLRVLSATIHNHAQLMSVKGKKPPAWMIEGSRQLRDLAGG